MYVGVKIIKNSSDLAEERVFKIPENFRQNYVVGLNANVFSKCMPLLSGEKKIISCEKTEHSNVKPNPPASRTSPLSRQPTCGRRRPFLP